MQKKRSIKIIAVVMILVLICVSITYVKTGNKEVLATTQEFNTENLQDNEHMHVEVDSSGDKVPVPNGYVGSKATGENEIGTGYVIYEGEEEVNDENVEEAQKTRNQYVWIPVPDASTMYGTDENGKKWGKLYTFTADTGDGIDPVTGAKPLNWSESDGIFNIINKNYEQEPNISSYDGDSLRIKYLNRKTKHEILIQLEKEFNYMIESVERYGGFYIGRYETGNLNSMPVTRKGFNTMNYMQWYNSYENCKELKGNNTNIETSLPWMSQYDMVFIWLIESGNKTKEEISKDSTNWGNYLNSTFEYMNNIGKLVIKQKNNNIMIPTGSSEYTKANNIYDLAGNVSEWTNGLIGNFKIVIGGSAYGDGTKDLISLYSKKSFPFNGYVNTGCRAMLYIK